MYLRRGWIPPLALLGLVVALGLGMGTAVLGEKKVDIPAGWPKEVRESVERAGRIYEQPLQGAQWTKILQMSGTDHPIYQVQGTNARGNRIEMEVTSAGRVIEVEEHGIPMTEVPEAVLEALKARSPDMKPEKIEAIFQGEQVNPVSYGFEGTDAAGNVVEIYIRADGKAVLN